MAEHRFAEWIERSVEALDVAVTARPWPLATTFDHDGARWPGDALPPLAYWSVMMTAEL